MPLDAGQLRQLSTEGEERRKRDAVDQENERRQKLENEIRGLPPLCERYLEEVAKTGRRETTVAYFMTIHYGSAEDPYYERIEHALTVSTSPNEIGRNVVCTSEEEGLEMLRTFYEHFRRLPGLTVKFRKGSIKSSVQVSW